MLSSLRNPRVKEVVRLRTRRHRDRERRFVVEGLRELVCAADAGLSVEVLFHCDRYYVGPGGVGPGGVGRGGVGRGGVEQGGVEQGGAGRGGRDLVERLGAAGVECVPTTPEVFEKLSYRRTPDGLLAVAPTPKLPLDRLNVPGDSLWLVAAGIEKPGNLGAMLRCADAAGANGMLLADPTTDVFNPNVVRASVGTLFSVPVAQGTATEVRAWLDAQRIRVVAARPDADSDLAATDLRGSLAIVVGSEHRGLGADWSPPWCETVRIPMAGRADSVNAAMAATVLLFEARRQRSVVEEPPSLASEPSARDPLRMR